MTDMWSLWIFDITVAGLWRSDLYIIMLVPCKFWGLLAIDYGWNYYLGCRVLHAVWIFVDQFNQELIVGNFIMLNYYKVICWLIVNCNLLQYVVLVILLLISIVFFILFLFIKTLFIDKFITINFVIWTKPFVVYLYNVITSHGQNGRGSLMYQYRTLNLPIIR